MISHRDDRPSWRAERDHIAGTWQNLTGRESKTVGVKRIRVDPGKWSTPLHLDGGAEGEIFYILGDLAKSAGSARTGLRLSEVLPGKLNAPPHCHSAEEEIFVVLDGESFLLL